MALEHVAVSTHITYALQLFVGLTFALAAGVKARHPRRFVRIVHDYELVPARVAGAVAAAIIVSECLVVASLLTGYVVQIALVVAIVMLGSFAVGTGVNVLRGRLIACGCFGDAEEEISRRTLARVATLLACSSLTLAFTSVGADVITATDLAGAGTDGLAYLAEMTVVSVSLLFVFYVAFTGPGNGLDALRSAWSSGPARPATEKASR